MKAQLAPTRVRVWYRLTERLGDDDVRLLQAELSPHEQVRCGRLVFARDRRDFAAAHALLRRTLSRYGAVAPREWRFQSDGQGKPVIVPGQGGSLTFNLSHTRGLVACAVTNGSQVGMDVEAIDESSASPHLAAQYFSPMEQDALSRCQPEEYGTRFVELWTLKESYIKAIGAGLTRALDTFTFMLEGERGIRLEAQGESDPDHWQFALAVPALGYRMAVAVRRGTAAARRITLQDHDAPERHVEPIRESS